MLEPMRVPGRVPPSGTPGPGDAATGHGIGLPRLLGIGTGALALAAIWALYNVFMPLLLGEFLESRALRGALMGLDNVVAVLLMPLVGAWSDRTEGRFGKRLPFLYVAMPLAALSFAALPLAGLSLWTLLAVDVVFLLSITFYRAPLAAIMPDHVPPERRSSANGVLIFMAALGGVVALLLLAPTFDQAPWIPFAVVAGATLASLGLVVLVADPDPPFVTTGTTDADAPPLRRLARDVRSLNDPRRRGALVLLLGIFASYFAYSAAEAQFSSFATGFLGTTPGSAGFVLAAASLAYLAWALPAGWLAKRFGELRVMVAGAALGTVGLALAGLFVLDTRLLAVFLVMLGMAWAMLMVPGYPLVANQGGRTRIGFYTGLYYLFGAAASVVSPAVAGSAMDLWGDRALFGVASAGMGIALALLLLAGRRGVIAATRDAVEGANGDGVGGGRSGARTDADRAGSR
jgi:MFS family permease